MLSWLQKRLRPTCNCSGLRATNGATQGRFIVSMGEAMVCRTCEWYLVNEDGWLSMDSCLMVLLNLFCVWKMVLGLLVADSFFMYAHSFTWNRFHSYISTSFLCFDWKASSPHGVMVHSCAGRLGMFVGETNLPVPWHQIHDSLRASTAASQDFLQGDGLKKTNRRRQKCEINTKTIQKTQSKMSLIQLM